MLGRKRFQWAKRSAPVEQVFSDQINIQGLLGTSEDFTTQLDTFVEAVSLGDEGYELRFGLCQKLTHYLSSFIPGSRVEVFGSTLTGFGLKDSDMDLFLNVPDEFFYNETIKREGLLTGQRGRGDPRWPGEVERDHKLVLRKLVKALRGHREFGQIQGIPKARVPIVKFVHLPSRLHCDIQSMTSSGVANSTLLGTLLRLDVRAPRLIYVIRFWAKQLGLTGGSDRTRALSNYAVCLLLVFYLTMKGVLPSINDLQSQVRPENQQFIDGWNVSFNANSSFVSENFTSPEYLLRDFFEFYAHELDPEAYVISMLDGVPIERKYFQDLDLPPSQNALIEKVMAGTARKFRLDSPLVVQDPFELDLNVTGVFSEYALYKFRTCCDIASNILSSAQRKDRLKDLFDERNYVLEAPVRKRKLSSEGKRRKSSDDHIAKNEAQASNIVLTESDESQAESSRDSVEAKRPRLSDDNDEGKRKEFGNDLTEKSEAQASEIVLVESDESLAESSKYSIQAKKPRFSDDDLTVLDSDDDSDVVVME